MKPLAFSPDSRLLAVISDADAFGRPNRVIDILDAANGKLKRRIVSLDDREIQSAAFASNSALAVATSLGAAVIDVKTGEPIRRWRFRAVAFVGGPRVYSPQSAISADGKTILALANGRDVTLYDATTGQKTRIFTLDKARRDPRLSPDGTLWALSLPDINYPSFYDARTGKKLVENLAYGEASRFQFWGAGSSRIVSPTPGKLAILDGRSAARVREVPGNLNAQTIALDPRGGFYYTLDKTGVIWRWRLR